MSFRERKKNRVNSEQLISNNENDNTRNGAEV